MSAKMTKQMRAEWEALLAGLQGEYAKSWKRYTELHASGFTRMPRGVEQESALTTECHDHFRRHYACPARAELAQVVPAITSGEVEWDVLEVWVPRSLGPDFSQDLFGDIGNVVDARGKAGDSVRILQGVEGGNA